MSSASNDESRQENLSESWIEFSRKTTSTATGEPTPDLPSSASPVKMASVNSKALEKLLLEAQRESSCASSHINSSLASSQASPRSSHSPSGNHSSNPVTTDVTSLQLDDVRLPHDLEGGEGSWVWDWSSRPEAVPPSTLQFRHPSMKKHRLSIRNTRIMRGIVFSLENLPVLVFTHACTFVLGAASMVFYLKRFCRWTNVTSATMSS